MIDFPYMKEPYTSIIPNGRLLAIEDPNTSITLWESGIIVKYLVETYDKQRIISFTPGSKEASEAKQWMFSKASGSSPYFGHAVWLIVYHPEKLPDVIDHYTNDICRGSSVLEGVLQNKDSLVGGKYSYADAVFVNWFVIVSLFADRVNMDTDPLASMLGWSTWRLVLHPAIEKVLRRSGKKAPMK